MILSVPLLTGLMSRSRFSSSAILFGSLLSPIIVAWLLLIHASTIRPSILGSLFILRPAPSYISTLVSPLSYISSSRIRHPFHRYSPSRAVGSLVYHQSSPCPTYLASAGSSAITSQLLNTIPVTFQ